MATIFTAVMDSPETNNAGNTIRQNVPLSGPSLGQIRVTFESANNSPTTSMSLNNASIGLAANSGTDSSITGSFGSSTFKELLFSGVNAGPTGAGGTGISGFKIGANPLQNMTSDWLTFAAGAVNVIIVMDYSSTGNNAEDFRGTATTGCNFYRSLSAASYNNNGAIGTEVGSGLISSIVLIETQAGGAGPTITLMGAICL